MVVGYVQSSYLLEYIQSVSINYHHAMKVAISPEVHEAAVNI
jgi:hypothetical protein